MEENLNLFLKRKPHFISNKIVLDGNFLLNGQYIRRIELLNKIPNTFKEENFNLKIKRIEAGVLFAIAC